MKPYLDPNREGPRNDRMQALQNSYQAICEYEGLQACAAIIPALESMGSKGTLQPEKILGAIAIVVGENSHTVAHKLLDSAEFRPLVQWYVDQVDGEEKKREQAVRLEDLGALVYQRALKEQVGKLFRK